MTVDLYKIAKDMRVLNKITGASPLNNTPITVKPTEKVSLLSPVFEIDMDATYMTANYLYCDTFDRYYYIRDVRVNTAQRLEFDCYIDVRQSFMNDMKNSELTVIRNEAVGLPTQISDNKLPVNPSRKIITSIVLTDSTHSFSADAAYSYLLTVVGGEPTINGGDQIAAFS